MEKNICLIISVLFLIISCHKEVNPISNSSSEEIVELMNSIETEKEFKNAYGMMLSSQFPNLTEGEINIALNQVQNKEMVGAIAKVYEQTFSEKELQVILSFLKTDAGKKWSDNQLVIMQKIEEERNKIYQKIDEKAIELNSNN